MSVVETCIVLLGAAGLVAVAYSDGSATKDVRIILVVMAAVSIIAWFGIGYLEAR